MKKIKALPEASFLKLFFALVCGAFLVGAVCMPDRDAMFSGFYQILTSPCKVSTNYFSIGGYAATFLNMGAVGLICLALFYVCKTPVNNVSTLAFLLTVGFCTWGINPLNMIPTVLGVVLYGLVKKEKMGSLVNAMLFSTGIAPLISELLLRYPGTEVGFSFAGLGLGLAVGLFIGFILPAGLPHSPKVHKGFDLYSAALPIGMTAFLLQGVLYKAPGVELPGASGTLEVASAQYVNIFCIALFGLLAVLALFLGCTPKQYLRFLFHKEQVTSVSGTWGNAVMLMNTGIYGLFILGYYNLVGAGFNGVTFGLIFCMLACCNSGSRPTNVLPIMLGYVGASYLFGWLSGLAGGNFAQAVNAQAIVIGLCYANGLSPLVDKYGWVCGIGAAMMHYCMVTTVPSLHGGFCLYNGGFTAALVCLLLVPVLEKFLHTKQERQALRTK